MGKGVKNLIGIVFGLAVFLGVGVVIGWFSKPAESIGEPEINRNPDLSIIDDFAKRVDSMKLRAESENLSKKIRYATGPVCLRLFFRISKYFRILYFSKIDNLFTSLISFSEIYLF